MSHSIRPLPCPLSKRSPPIVASSAAALARRASPDTGVARLLIEGERLGELAVEPKTHRQVEHRSERGAVGVAITVVLAVGRAPSEPLQGFLGDPARVAV
jgi:hypothetical protein